jgi:hypothetical protein
MPKDHGSQIKDDELYERLREEGDSKEKAARIAYSADAWERFGGGRRGGEWEGYV